MNKIVMCCITIYLTFTSLIPHSTAWEYKEHKLENGITLITIPFSTVPIVYMNVRFLGGSFYETPKTDGLVHLLEHMILKGNDLAKDAHKVREKQEQLGILSNASVSITELKYYAYFPSSFLNEVVEFQSEVAQSSLLDSQQLEKEKSVVLDEYERSMSRLWFKPYSSMSKILTGQIHTTLPIGATKKNIKEATATTLKKLKQAIIDPQNTMIFLAGDITHDQGLEVMRAYFGDWKSSVGWKKIPVPQALDLNLSQKTKRWNFSHPKASHASIQLIFKGPNTKDQPDECVVAGMITAMLYHSAGKFYQIYLKSGKWYNGGISTNTSFYFPRLYLFASVKADEVGDVINELLELPKQWIDPNYFTEDQLEDIKRQIVVGKKIQEENPLSYVSGLMSMATRYSLDFFDTRYERYHQVTLEDMRRLIKKYLIESQHLISVIYNDEEAAMHNVDLNGDRFYDQHVAAYIESDDS